MTPAHTINCPVYGGLSKSAGSPRVKARYDNAITNPENARNWWGADYLSPKSANSFAVRRTLRNRSRYEVGNNPYLYGITHNNADDLIGTGPTLQVYTNSPAYNRKVEKLWAEWCEEVGLVEKLRTVKMAKSIDGEGFLILKTVDDLESPVKLYPCDVEADQVTSSFTSLENLWLDGLELHPVTGRPTAYHVLKAHPGDFYFPGLNPLATEKVPAKSVIHWFQRTRPGQIRGLPIFSASLDLFGELRAFRKAVVANAQIAACHTGVLEQDLGYPEDDEDQEYVPYKRIPAERGGLLQLAPGQRLNKFDAAQPQTTYEMFQEKLLGEAVRPLGYPLNLALGTSQKFNFSSSKLDHINYRNGLNVERSQCNKVALNRLFAAFYEEAVLNGALEMWNGLAVPPHEWHWPDYASIDPESDARADSARIAAGLMTWQEFWARRGFDYRDVFQQFTVEHKLLDKLGLSFGDVLKRAVSVTETNDGDGGGSGSKQDAGKKEYANAA